MMHNHFSLVPVEVWADKRLTLEQIRVLGVLLSFRSKNTDVVWPSRSQIAERCGMNVSNISTATTALERLGWLRKEGKGGHSKSTRYTIAVPDLVTLPEVETVADPGTDEMPMASAETVAESGTVAEPTTVAGAARRPVAQQARGLRVAESARGKEETKNKPEEQTSSPAAQVSDSLPAVPPCPVQQIVELFHRHLPDNPRCKILNAKRQGMIRARWKEAARLDCNPFGYRTQAEGLQAWARFFEICALSDFLTGKTEPQPGKPPFVADIDFLMSPSGFVRTLENRYHRGGA